MIKLSSSRPHTGSVGVRNRQNDNSDTIKMVSGNNAHPKGAFENFSSIKIYKKAKEDQHEGFEIEKQNRRVTISKDRVLPGSSCCKF